MPKLTYHDVFLTDKSEVLAQFEQTEKQIQAFGFAVAYLMLRNNINSVTVYRDELTQMLQNESMSEGFAFNFEGDGDKLTVSLVA